MCRYRKRGLAVLPTKFGISFTFKPLNQAGALVNIYVDGSVSAVHGGVEMGQGLHTKMCQVAAQALQVPLSVRFRPLTLCQRCRFSRNIKLRSSASVFRVNNMFFGYFDLENMFVENEIIFFRVT